MSQRAISQDKRNLAVKYEPFGIPVIIIPFDGGGGLLKTRIIEAGEGSAIYVTYRVIWYEKVFLPPHVNEIARLHRLVVERIGIEILGILIKRLKFTLEKQNTCGKLLASFPTIQYSRNTT